MIKDSDLKKNWKEWELKKVSYALYLYGKGKMLNRLTVLLHSTLIKTTFVLNLLFSFMETWISSANVKGCRRFR
jgi:hypothetical protein